MRQRHFLVLASLTLFSLTSCQNYDYKINDTTVYRPSSLLRDIEAQDSALSACIAQTIADQKINKASQLETLNCSHAGVTSIAGLAQFGNLSQLKLANNQIKDISELAGLPALKTLSLSNNKIVDIPSIPQLEALTTLDLSGNDGLDCLGKSNLIHVQQLILPAHCDAQ